MKHTILPLFAALALFAAAPALAADGAHPTVVELFQSQGCSSCPPANANLMALAGRPDILPLAFQVTYWDNLAWRDTFASPVFTGRQKDYARALRAGVFTPEIVVNGRRDGVGINPGELRGLIAAGDRGAAGPSVALASGRVVVGPGRGGGADVWLVRYDPRVLQVPIRGGENAGRTLPHRNVVRQLVRLGRWDGRADAFALPATPDPVLKSAVLVQAPGGGPILAAARL
ncbi:MAG TPA: DUF1223 domain-containing protein [Caulobacteraceae bacterium]|jgi:hypothetical protein|nr:DUF1223 domain-containing protein [Caulobacteraceae bacterium]